MGMKLQRRGHFWARLLIGVFSLLCVACMAGAAAVEYWGSAVFDSGPAIFAELSQVLSGTPVALWYLATVFMLIAVYIAQRMELRSQREDLELLNTSVERERIERTFFELIKVHHRIVEGVTFKNANNEELSGRRCFQDIYSQLKEVTLLSDNPRPESDTAIFPYEKFVEAKFNAYLDHYFRNLFHIVAYVDQSSHQDKKALLKVLRAQLSGSELLLLFYNGLSKYGRDKFYPLIVRYAFLEHLSKSQLLDPKHESLYPETAYHDEE
jgi:hypothetical protein